MTIWIVLLIIGLVLAFIDELRAKGEALTTWAVIFILVYLLRGVL